MKRLLLGTTLMVLLAVGLAACTMPETVVVEREADCSDTERYIALEISANLLQVAFTERRSRLTKTLTYDFDRRQVHGVMFLPGGEIVTLLGEIVDGPERRPA